MSTKVAGTGVPRSEQITPTRDYRAQQQTKILHVDCWTAGLLSEGSRPEDQKIMCLYLISCTPMRF
jgi:hypothetical protein